MTRDIRNKRAEQLQGGRAGFVSRVSADGIDLLVIEVIYIAILVGIAVVRFLIDHDFTITAPNLAVTVIAQWCIIVLYLGTNWSSTGRSIGKSILGLRASDLNGETLKPVRAFTRALFCATFYPTLLWILVSRRNAGLHDALFRTQVLYDWHTVAVAPEMIDEHASADR